MSLLLQALQKAAKTRESTGGESPESASLSNSYAESQQSQPLDQLSLEEAEEYFDPGAASNRGDFARTAVEPTLELEPTLDTPADADFDPEPEPPKATLRSVRSLDRAPSHEQAAAIMRASETRSTGVLDWVRDRPVYAFAALSLVFLLGYGGYVYLQIFQPGILRGNFGTKTQLKAKAPPPSPVAATPAQTLPASQPTAAPTNPPAVIAAPTNPTSAPIAGLPQAPSASAPSGTGTGTAAPPPAPAPQSAAPPVRAPKAAPRARQGRPVRPAPPAMADESGAPDTPASEMAATTLEDTVDVRRASPQLTPPLPSLTDAWTALQQGRLEQAQALYESVLVAEPQNVDAMIGLAAIATQRGANDAAARYFERALQLDPRNTAAQAGLISILGQADLQLSESRLKDLISREPSANLYFALGNMYARQALWAPAQQAYFQAMQMQPDNPDYAYNLAVGLEHLGQPRIALGYYRKALELASLRGTSSFDRNRVQERIGQLAARLSGE